MGIVQGLMMSYPDKPKYSGPDIVLKVVTSGASQTIRINKYFNVANYTIDRGDGTTTTATATYSFGAHSKTYASAGTYYVTLVNPGTRWIFTSRSVGLVPSNGFTGDSVGIEYMPSLKDWFGDSSSAPGNNFFQSFNRSGALTSLPSGSFDTSSITSVGDNFFRGFNNSGALTSLPSGSFDTSNITSAGSEFFSSFNYSGALTSLPSGSFDTSSITSVGNYFFYNFNNSGAIPKVSAGTGVAIYNASSGSVDFHYAPSNSSDSISAGNTFDGYAKS